LCFAFAIPCHSLLHAIQPGGFGQNLIQVVCRDAVADGGHISSHIACGYSPQRFIYLAILLSKHAEMTPLPLNYLASGTAWQKLLCEESGAATLQAASYTFRAGFTRTALDKQQHFKQGGQPVLVSSPLCWKCMTEQRIRWAMNKNRMAVPGHQVLCPGSGNLHILKMAEFLACQRDCHPQLDFQKPCVEGRGL